MSNVGPADGGASIIGNDGATVSSRANRDAKKAGKSMGEGAAEGFIGKVGKWLSNELAKITKASGGGGGQGGPPGSSVGQTKMAATDIRGGVSALIGQQADIAATFGQRGVMGTIGRTRMAGGGAAMGAAMGAVAGVNMAIDAANARFERGREGVLAADRMSVLYQQMTGMSQLGVSSTYRMPLTNYRLGAGGINDLMSMEASLGLSGRQQAASIEAMRTMSGYSLSAGDVASQLGSLASAPTVNRMFMMTGQALIGPGGRQNTGMSVMQNLVQAAGLTDEATLKSALLPGSITRSKLAMMGVPPEMITQVIQYAQQNLTFKGKGGRGMYDPSREADRRRMGIEENFATQVEETQRLETKRDENFYRRQVDNYAYLERQTQSLTRAFGALEDRLSGVLGVLGSNRIATSIFQGVTSPLGDPDGMGGSTIGRTTPAIDKAKTQSGFNSLHPTFKERLTRMMADNPNVTFGNGVRSADSQRQMFLSRYRQTNSPTNASGKANIYWEGSYWEHHSGPAAAPPGLSMHEIGLAADLGGDTDWVVANAHKYGLKHFKDVNGEPWHVQPAELPNGRKEYEKQGAPWGHGTGSNAQTDMTSNFGAALDHRDMTSYAGAGSNKVGVPGSVRNGRALTISERVAKSIAGDLPTAIQGRNLSRNTSRSGGSIKGPSGTPISVDMPPDSGGTAKSGVDVLQWSADFLRAVGAPVTQGNLHAMSAWIAAEGTRAKFNPLAVVSNPSEEIFGVGGVELGWDEFNTDGVTNFVSYNQGLMTTARHITKYQKGVINALKNSSNSPYDVVTAIEKAVAGWTSDVGEPYAARSVLESRGVPQATGDPAGVIPLKQSSSSSPSLSVSGGTTINLSPTINISGSGSPSDLRKIANELVHMVKRELELESLRSS